MGEPRFNKNKRTASLMIIQSGFIHCHHHPRTLKGNRLQAVDE